MNNQIFKKVHLSDKKRILRQIADEETILLIKVENQDVKQVIAKNIIDDKILQCYPQPGFEFSLSMPEIVVVNLSIGEDRYFFSGMVSVGLGKVTLDIRGDLFILQRRRSVRMEIPDSYSAVARPIDKGGKPLSLAFKILDISSGGCRLAFNAMDPMIKIDTQFKILISLGQRNTFETMIQVRHIKEVKTIDDLPQVFGVQYIYSDSIFEAKMLNLYMDVQKEVFLKHYKK